MLYGFFPKRRERDSPSHSTGSPYRMIGRTRAVYTLSPENIFSAKRRERESNPRYLAVYTLSKRAH